MAVLAPLAPDEWDDRSTGGRTPRAVVAHLLAVDAALRGGRVGAVTRIPPEPGPLVGVNLAAGARWEATPVPDLLDLLDRSGERLARRVALLPAPLARVPVRGPAGPGRLLDVIGWHVLDEWVRIGDLVGSSAGPGGVPLADRPDPGLVVDAERGTVFADVVLATVPRRVLPRVHRATGVARFVVELAGPVTTDEVGLAVGPRRTWAADFARRHYGPRVSAAPDVVVRITAPALVLVASGRAVWRSLPPEALRLDGDADLGADLLDALAPVSTEHPR